ncbi:MAG: flagellar biosynthetic protein FliR [Phycisphaerales bacterium]|nr:flagellar biosynthetic protein FliR [Phycisphaerales bacterium]
MPTDLIATYLNLPQFALIVSRIAGVVVAMPLFGGLAVPANVRILLIIALAALIAPIITPLTAPPETLGGLVTGMIGEALLGALVGVVLSMIFVGLQIGAMLIAQESGLAYGQVVDPTTSEEETVLGTFFVQLATVIFLIVGGHRALIGATLDTFERIPLLRAESALTGNVDVLLDALAASMDVTVRVATPTVLALFLSNVALGFLSRTLPQLNVLNVGFALKGVVAFAVMTVSLPTAMEAFVSGLERIVDWLQFL